MHSLVLDPFICGQYGFKNTRGWFKNTSFEKHRNTKLKVGILYFGGLQSVLGFGVHFEAGCSLSATLDKESTMTQVAEETKVMFTLVLPVLHAKTQTNCANSSCRALPDQAKGVALIEGLWTRYFPAVEHARAAVELGVKIQFLQFSAAILL